VRIEAYFRCFAVARSASVRGMNAVLNEVLQAALALPVKARETLIAQLLESVESEGVDLDPEAEEILVRRLASAEAGNVIEADELLRQIRAKRG